MDNYQIVIQKVKGIISLRGGKFSCTPSWGDQAASHRQTIDSLTCLPQYGAHLNSYIPGICKFFYLPEYLRVMKIMAKGLNRLEAFRDE